MRRVRVGFSPCPNDTFLFYALVHGLVDTEGYVFEPRLEDVETLNRRALTGEPEMTKASFGILPQLRERYWCLRSGAALGRGCGPLVVARSAGALEALADQGIAVPGLHTTANLLLDLRLGRQVPKVPLVFHEIMPAVARGEVAAGLVIHEGRFTYSSHGLVAIEDLGQWWEGRTGLPIPLGGIFLRRGAADLDPVRIQRALRRSVEFALHDPVAPLAYVRDHAREMDPGVVDRHIELYVNGFTVDVGSEGERAVDGLLGRATGSGPEGSTPLFPREGP